MYMNFREKGGVKRVFDAMKERSVVSWNIMINGYFKNGFAKTTLMLF